MTSDPDPTRTQPPSQPDGKAGRPVVLTPVPPGLWLVIGGGVVAALGPLFGFLIGTIMGSGTEVADLEPIYLFLFLGLLVGALGVGMIILGARRLYRPSVPGSR